MMPRSIESVELCNNKVSLRSEQNPTLQLTCKTPSADKALSHPRWLKVKDSPGRQWISFVVAHSVRPPAFPNYRKPSAPPVKTRSHNAKEARSWAVAGRDFQPMGAQKVRDLRSPVLALSTPVQAHMLLKTLLLATKAILNLSTLLHRSLFAQNPLHPTARIVYPLKQTATFLRPRTVTGSFNLSHRNHFAQTPHLLLRLHPKTSGTARALAYLV